MKRTEKTSSQSMPFTGTLERGPWWSASVTFLSELASKPGTDRISQGKQTKISHWGFHTIFFVFAPVWLEMKEVNVSSVLSVWLKRAMGLAPWKRSMLGTATVPNLVERLEIQIEPHKKQNNVSFFKRDIINSENACHIEH